MGFFSLATLVLKVSTISLIGLAMKQLVLVISLAVNLFILCVFPGLAAAKNDASEQLTPALLTQEVIQLRISEIKDAPGLDETSKATLLELYRKSLSNMEATVSSEEAARKFEQLAETAPEETQRIREEIGTYSTADERDSLSLNEAASLSQVEALLQEEKAELLAVNAIRTDVERLLEEATGRPVQIRQRLAEVRKQQEEDAIKMELPSSSDISPEIIEARQWMLETHTQALSAEIRMLDQELISYSVRMNLLESKEDQASSQARWIRKRIKSLEKIVTSKGQNEAEQATVQAETTRREAEGKHSLVVRLAEKNATLSEEIAGMVSGLSELTGQTVQANRGAQRLEEDFKSARETVEIGGLNQELGHMLFTQRQSLPDERAFRRQASEREERAAQIGVQRLQHRLEQKRLGDLDAYVSEVTATVSEEELPLLRDQINKLAIERKGLLVKAIETDDFYLLRLGELETAQQRLLSAISSYDAFLAENLLWVRSASKTGLASLGSLPEQAWQILSPKGWLDVMRTFWRESTRSPLNLLIVIALGALLLKRKYLLSISDGNSNKIGKPTVDHFAYSVQVLFITIILAAVWPIVMAVSGWLIKDSTEGTYFSNIVGNSLIQVALQLFYLRLLQMICLPGGLAATHFLWPESSLQLLRRVVSGLIWVYLPAAMVSIIAFNFDPLNAGWIIGRVAFLVMVGALAYAFYQTLHPARGVLTGYLRRQEGRGLKNLYWLSYPVLVAAPIMLGLLSLMGFIYTAGTLLSLLIETIWLGVGLILLVALAQRWLLVTRRHVAYEVAMEQREAQLDSHRHANGLYQEIEEPEPDLAAFSDASRKLLNTMIIFIGAIGLWLIWSEVLPAFRILDDVALWNSTVKVDGVEHALPVTLTDIVLTLLYLIATIILAKQLPAVLEIILLQYSEMSAASRYTVTTLSTYTIVTIGAVLIFSAVGVDWSKLQWLVAALGVGIGFGLQEIVANFISGIIILFERPIRVGDVVTVGDTDGKVTRIRIRATTIQNWDGKELLVPNKEFITGRLLNWSLSDQTTRILILVGIAYGSDVRQAISLLEEAARENGRVMEDPEPSVIFEAFGDSALNMVLRCFIESADGRMGIISSLNESINEKLSNAGISIAFPQRDINLKTSEPLSVRIEGAENSVLHHDRGA